MSGIKLLTKVPGDVARIKAEECITNVSNLSMPVLLETLERQKKLLANSRSFVSKLPDKGERIARLKAVLEGELNARKSKEDDLCEVMSGLKIDGRVISDSLEWQGKCVPGETKPTAKGAKSSDDENDVLKILVTHSSATQNKKETSIEEPEEPLIKDSDLTEPDTTLLNEDPYVINMCKKFENTKVDGRFLPHKSLNKHPKESPLKERDLSAATPPPMRYPDAKVISLQQSISLQLEQAKHLKEVQIKHAAERLKDRSCLIGDKLPPPETIAAYRETPASDSEEEIHDECVPEDTGGVVFTITD